MEEMREAFEAKLTEVRGVVALRRCGSEHAEELAALARRTDELEAEVAELQRRVAEERAVLEEQAAEVRMRLEEQQAEIVALNAALPSHMKPRQQPPPVVPATTTATAAATTSDGLQPPKHKRKAESCSSGTRGSSNDAGSAGKVTEEELAEIPSYMRGRLTAERCNEALSEARRLTAARYKLLAGSGRDNSARRDKARDLEELAKQQAGFVPGTRFFSEAEVATSTVLKLDTAGRMLLSTLRHLGRLKEFSVKGCKCWVVL